MANTPSDDPWDWGIERVILELCTTQRTSWKPFTKSPTLPDPRQLADSLRHNEVNGLALLTHYDDSELLRDLKVTKAGQKNTLIHAFREIRKRSTKFRLYQQQNDEEEDAFGGAGQLDGREDQPSDDLEMRLVGQDEGLLSHQSTPLTQTAQSPLATLPNPPDAAGSDEPTKKKRRIAPITLSSDVDVNVVRNIPTEADFLLHRLEPVQDLESAQDTRGKQTLGAYLGMDALSRVDIKDRSNGEVGHADDQSDDTFTFTQKHGLPPGRRLQVHRLFKRLLLPKPDYHMGKADAIFGADNPDNDDIITLLGHSDNEYDSDTWEEIEREREEVNARFNAGLSPEQINAILDERVEGFENVWKEKKLPKLSRKGHAIWKSARRTRTWWSLEVRRQQDVISRLEVRISKLRENILLDAKVSKADVERMAGNMEQSIMDHLSAIWTLDLIKSPTGPEKVSDRLRKRSKSDWKSYRVLDDDGAESLTSESDGSVDGGQDLPLDDFMVMDDDFPPVDTIDDPMEITAEATATVVGTDFQTPPPHIRTPQKNDEDTAPLKNGGLGKNGRRETPLSRFESVDLVDLSQADEADGAQTPSKAAAKPVVDPVALPESSTASSSQENRENSMDGRRLKIRVKPKPPKLPLPEEKDMTIAEKLVYDLVVNMGSTYQVLILQMALDQECDSIWHDIVLWTLNRSTSAPYPPYRTDEEKDVFATYLLLQMFESYIQSQLQVFRNYRPLTEEHKQAIRNKAPEFGGFLDFVRRIAVLHTVRSNRAPAQIEDRQAGARTRDTESRRRDDSQVADDPARTEDDVPLGRSDPKADSEKETAMSGDGIIDTPSKKHKKVVRDKAAQHLRDSDRRRMQEQEERRKILHARIATGFSQVSQDDARLIINESKEDHHDLIYVPENIAPRIKDHQIAGVRFMWNQIVMDSAARQGCLLAHTMGLGKTMQVITLLMAIADAATSDNDRVSSQVPEELVESKTLILAPPTLVDNWIDELLLWVPADHAVGEFFKVDSSLNEWERKEEIRAWDARGGILVMGYHLFKQMVHQESLGTILIEKPNIVVADEAHHLKNPKSKVHEATARFKTYSRIALTGSPLANSVVEYFAMINWVAPNYLGSLAEFRGIFAIPIEEGLSIDSSQNERRKALKMLRVLRDTVAPKISRSTITVLKADIPQKTEFVLKVPLTQRQLDCYVAYMTHQRQGVVSTGDDHISSARIFGVLNVLGLICNHPVCFLKKLEEERAKQGKKKRPQQESDDDASSNFALPAQLISNELTRLRGLSDLDDIVHSWKIPLLSRILDESRKLGDGVLVFSQSIPTLDYLEKVLRRQKRAIMRLDGSTAISERQSMVKEFNKSFADVFLISTNAGGLGLNIIGANRVVIFDFKFNPQNEQQAVGRAYRIGQRKPVFVYRFFCGGTFEENLQQRAVFKMQLASRVVDKKNPVPRARRLDELLAMPKESSQAGDLDTYLGKDAVLDEILKSPELRTGVQSILLTDTFEQEKLEDAELPVEDQREVEDWVRRFSTRPPGISLAETFTPQAVPTFTPPGASPAANNGTLQDRIPPVPAIQHDTAIVANPAGSTPPLPGNFELRPIPQPTPSSQPASVQNQSIREPSHGGTVPSSTNPQHPIPQPVAGASTHFRQYSHAQDVSRHSNEKACKGELSRAFINMQSETFNKDKRRQVADNINAAIWDLADERDDHHRAEIALKIVEACQSKRFVEAICVGIITPRQLATLSLENIGVRRRQLDNFSDHEWNKEFTSHFYEGDPEKQLRSIKQSSAALRDGQASTPQKSHRLGDERAIEAVIQRRKVNQTSTAKSSRGSPSNGISLGGASQRSPSSTPTRPPRKTNLPFH